MNETTLRLTEDNISTALQAGDVILGAEELGTVRSARMTVHDNGTAVIFFDGANGAHNKEIFGIPQTLTVHRKA